MERAISGDLNCSDLSVFDMENWRKEAYDERDLKPYHAPKVNWVTYHIIGRVHTWWDNFQTSRHNRALRRKRRGDEIPGTKAARPGVEPPPA